MKRFVYSFSEGSKEMKKLLGGKGANLAEMCKIGLSVPPGFTISTEACNEYYQKNKELWEELLEEIKVKLEELEKNSGKFFGGETNPLLVSVRSGSAVSMPGMMDTVLNLGLNDSTVNSLAKESSNAQFAYDSYRRFIQMFSDVVMEVEKYKFDEIMDRLKVEKNYSSNEDLKTEDLEILISKFKDLYKKETKQDFPNDPFEQLSLTIKAVFNSWENPRAVIYREINDIPSNIGTAVTVQSMVFGNMGLTSGTGVAFTRNPSTGEAKLYGEYLMNAQGEDVVAGIRTPKSIETLKDAMPSIYEEFIKNCEILEKNYKDMQDIEFTIEKAKLYLLQTRSGKRTAKSAIKIAVDLVTKGVITKEEAILRIEPSSLNQLLHKNFEEKSLKNGEIIAEGLPASPGAASGKVYFNSKSLKEAGKGILVRLETSPEDIEGMYISDGILTVRGGMTSHAAVVARGMGKCCISGCGNITINEGKKEFSAGNLVVKEGDFISLDGTTGKVYLREIEKKEVELDENFQKLMGWVENIKKISVKANADTPKDCEIAVKFGAEGVGLCRTEHMFFEEEKIWPVRQMIVARDDNERKEALDKLLIFQKKDFIGIFRAMRGKSVTIRLLDPPLHEFLPHKEEEIVKLSNIMDINLTIIKERIQALEEFNPMLGHRGCRLGITFPDIYEMQAKAIILAAIEVKKEGIDVYPEIMIPLIAEAKELIYLNKKIRKVVDDIIKESNVELNYKMGTMIEVPRACVTSDEIACETEFFSFGTNDLTQISYGFSRDDSNKFIPEYKNKKILEADPFQSIDVKGVGILMEISMKLAKQKNSKLKFGVCGEHGGDPKSIAFFHSLGLDYVSCSPFRVPIARLALAQEEIRKSSINNF